MTTRNFTKIVRSAKNASHCILVVWARLIYHIMIDNEQVVNSIHIQQMTGFIGLANNAKKCYSENYNGMFTV